MQFVDALFNLHDGDMPAVFAGRRAPRGLYLNVESGNLVDLEVDGVLPASLDGRVAAYVLAPPRWGEVKALRGSLRNR